MPGKRLCTQRVDKNRETGQDASILQASSVANLLPEKLVKQLDVDVVKLGSDFE